MFPGWAWVTTRRFRWVVHSLFTRAHGIRGQSEQSCNLTKLYPVAFAKFSYPPEYYEQVEALRQPSPSIIRYDKL